MPPEDHSGRGKAPGSGTGREVIFEYVPVGASVKISAIDVETGTEVSVVGPATASRMELERVALGKLRYMLQKKVSGDTENPSGTDDRQGGILI